MLEWEAQKNYLFIRKEAARKYKNLESENRGNSLSCCAIAAMESLRERKKEKQREENLFYVFLFEDWSLWDFNLMY